VKRFKIFNSLGVITILVLVAMVLTTITGSASTERDLHIRQQSLVQSHLYSLDGQPDLPAQQFLQR
jgi:hypothetical protein